MKFTDCVEIVGSKPTFYDGTKQYVSTGAVEEFFINENSIEEYTYNDRPSRADLIGKAGDILFAKMAETKKTIIIDKETEKYLFSTGFFAIRPINGIITTKCLYYLLNSKTFLSQKDKNSSGATQKAITNTGLEKINVNIPPFSKQEQIVKQFDLLTNIINNSIKELEKLDLLIKSRFIEMFGKSNFSVNTIGDLCYLNRYPTFYGFEYQSTGIPVIKIGNIGVNSKVSFSKDSFDCISEEINNRYPDTQIELFDIVMAVRGDGSTAKKIGIIEDDRLYHANISPNLIIFRIKKELNPYYLLYFLLSEEGQKRLDKYVTKTAKKTITATDIKKIEIQVPPIALQNDFAAFVQQIDKSKFAVQKALDDAKILYKSLMQEYFG